MCVFFSLKLLCPVFFYTFVTRFLLGQNLDKSSMRDAQESNEENDTINVALQPPNENEIH